MSTIRSTAWQGRTMARKTRAAPETSIRVRMTSSLVYGDTLNYRGEVQDILDKGV